MVDLKKEGFERIDAGRRGKLPKRTISLTTSRLSFSTDFKKALVEYSGVEIFINRKTKTIILVPSNNEVKLTKISKPMKGEDKVDFISSAGLKKEGLKTKLYEARLNLGKISFEYELEDGCEK